MLCYVPFKRDLNRLLGMLHNILRVFFIELVELYSGVHIVGSRTFRFFLCEPVLPHCWAKVNPTSVVR